jgi:hypothetical protein
MWEKGPFEPYASPKPVNFYALWPDIDMLTSAATDFFLRLGTTSGLKTNIQKSSVAPIQCSALDIETVQGHLPCHIEDFPLKYLGLPLSLKKLTKSQLQPLIDRLADLLPGWKSDLTRAGRAVQVQFVLIATVIYHAMALDLPTWALKSINKICRNYLWRGRKEALGGHCLIAWPKVARPKELGGLGIPDIKNLNRALRLRWLWLRKTEPSKPWASLPFQANADLEAVFSMAVVTEIGDGTNTLFWQDRWLFGKSIGDLAPTLAALIPTKNSQQEICR